MDVYFNFDLLRAFEGLETMTMKEFLETIAKPGLLKIPLPNNDVDLKQKPLWNYLEKACYWRIWAPKDSFIAFNFTDDSQTGYIGSYDAIPRQRLEEYILKPPRVIMEYNESFHSQRAIYFPGSEKNRLLTHFYSYLFFPDTRYDHLTKRFMRDRFRYHDEIFCMASKIVSKLLFLQNIPLKDDLQPYLTRLNGQSLPDFNLLPLDYYYTPEILANKPKFVAFHIRRGDFQQKFTRLPAEKILSLTAHLIPHRKNTIAYISTDETNISFFQPFVNEYRQIYFLKDLVANTGIEKINQNFIGMIEQAICVSADTFIGTPLSTFTAYITRMRGHMNRSIEIPVYKHKSATTTTENLESEEELERWITMDRRGIYDRTLYFMKHHMYQLQQKPKFNFPLWVRDFADAFKDIDD
jgi:hypothetical protein